MKYGALPPSDATYQIGDRADKFCITAAIEAAALKGVVVDFDTMQYAIDTYLRSAAKFGSWRPRRSAPT